MHGPVPSAPLRTGRAACHRTRLSGGRAVAQVGTRHLASLPALLPSAWCPSPCGRLSRPPRWAVTPTTTTAPPCPWDSRPVGHPAFPRSSTCERDVGAPSVPLNGLVAHRPPGGGFARRLLRRAIRVALHQT